MTPKRIRVVRYDILSNDDQSLVDNGLVGSELDVLSAGPFSVTQNLTYVEVKFRGELITVFSDEFEVIE